MQTPQISINITYIHPYTPTAPQTLSRHIQTTKEANTYQPTSADVKRHFQPSSNNTCEGLGMSGTHLGVSVGAVCFCWLQLVHELCLGDVLGYWVLFGWCLWMFTVFGCVWGVILVLTPCRVQNLHRFDIALKVAIFFTWPHWDIKISKCPHISWTKMVGFCLFLVFLCLSERN